MQLYTCEQWNKRYQYSRRRLADMIDGDMPRSMIKNECRLLLNAYYCGPWRAIMSLIMLRNETGASLVDEARMLLNSCYGGSWKAIFGLICYELKSVWEDLKFRLSESERAKVFRRIPSPAEEIAERILDEEIALNEMAKQL